MVILIDIDGTICPEGPPRDRPQARPLKGAIEAVNRLTDGGHVVVLWTGRGWDEYAATKEWLPDHGLQDAPLPVGEPDRHLVLRDPARPVQRRGQDYARPGEPQRPKPPTH